MKTSSRDGVVGRAELHLEAGLAEPRGQGLGDRRRLARAPPRAGSRGGARRRPPPRRHPGPGAQDVQGGAPRLGHDLDHHARLGRAQRVGRVHGEDAALVHERHARAALGLVEVGRRQQQGEPLALEAGEEPPEVAARDGVDAGGGLVEDEQLRRVDEGAGERQLLLHAAREPLGQAVAEGRHPHHLEELVAAGAVAAHVVDLGEEGDVLVHGEVAVEREALREVADARGERGAGSSRGRGRR